MSMAPVPTASSTQPGGSAGQAVASSSPRVTPVPAAPAGQAVTSGGAGVVVAPMAGQAGSVAQQLSAQALLTLLQTLGKPLSGTVQSGGSSGSLPLQLTMPQLMTGQSTGTQGSVASHAGAQTASGPATHGQSSGAVAPGGHTATGHALTGQATGAPTASTPTATASTTTAQNPPRQLTTNLPTPPGTTPPAPGTPVQVQAEGSGTAVRIGVTITGQAPVSPDSLRADAVRQASLAPLMGDVAKLAGQPSAAKGVTAAIERLMGFTLDADVPLSGQALRAAVEGGRGGPTLSGKPTVQTPSGSPPSGAAPTGAMQGSVPNAPTAASQDRAATALQSSTVPQIVNSFQPGAATANTMQTALGALIRALGLVQSDAGSASNKPADSQITAPPPGKSVPPPQPADARPSKLPATPLPADTPDLGNPTQIQALKSKAEAALSRLNLLQAQEPASVQRGGDSVSSLRWDVPLFIGQEAALLGVAIDQDGGQDSEKDGTNQTWRFRFSFESRALGGIEGIVALHQPGDAQHIDVAVWAGEPHVLSRLEARREILVERLQALDLTVDSLTLGSTDDLPEPAEQPVHHRVDVSS